MQHSFAVVYLVLASIVVASGESPTVIVISLLGTGVCFVFAGWMWRIEKRGTLPKRMREQDIAEIEDYINSEKASDVD